MFVLFLDFTLQLPMIKTYCTFPLPLFRPRPRVHCMHANGPTQIPWITHFFLCQYSCILSVLGPLHLVGRPFFRSRNNAAWLINWRGLRALKGLLMVWSFHCGFSRFLSLFSFLFKETLFWYLASLREQFGYLLSGVFIRVDGKP